MNVINPSPAEHRLDADLLAEAGSEPGDWSGTDSGARDFSGLSSQVLASTLKINEIFHSIQGESTWAGMPCIFIRLTSCDLRCTYCDTEYAFFEGKKKTLSEILAEVKAYRCPLVEITGGEPLLQKRVHHLMAILCQQDYTVLLETSGAHDISGVDDRVHRIMDLKCPSSGESARNFWPNLSCLEERDEVKFVIGTKEDYEWACQRVREGQSGWASRVRAILFSPVHGTLSLSDLAESIVEERLPKVRMQLQMHKYIWSPTQRGV